ncbi:MAG: hypothetical protein NTW67_05935 [Candidatus Woesearchaeota archaeon]|nr:hypothetical protein [Candidatus Woesearchaeota archaeon]
MTLIELLGEIRASDSSVKSFVFTGTKSDFAEEEDIARFFGETVKNGGRFYRIVDELLGLFERPGSGYICIGENGVGIHYWRLAVSSEKIRVEALAEMRKLTRPGYVSVDEKRTDVDCCIKGHLELRGASSIVPAPAEAVEVH